MPINTNEKLVYHSDSEAQSPHSLDPETTLNFTLQTDLVIVYQMKKNIDPLLFFQHMWPAGQSYW